LTTFASLFVPETIRDAVSDTAWLEAMVDAERALANAASIVGALDAAEAAAVAEACDSSLYDVNTLAAEGRAVANPVEPLVRALRERAPAAHRGATSQDILDTAAMLVATRAVELIVEELRGAEEQCALLAREYRSAPMAARTLLQQAVPTTFGYVAAQWLVALRVPRLELESLELPAQLGGAAGTLAAFGERGLDVKAQFARELGLFDPLLPWHASRAPVAELAAFLDQAAQAAAKIGLDVVLLAQTEVGEVKESAGGGSSTMPHKQNPARAVRARACARGAHAQAPVLAATGDHELQRAAGAWQAEWNALSELLGLTGGAAGAIRECLESLEVDTARMRENMRDGLYAERDAFGLEGDYLGAAEAFVDAALG
jgi:3-carboxy-cis,cis-muconate cycloisomerase